MEEAIHHPDPQGILTNDKPSLSAIAVGNCLGKILDKLVLDQISDHVITQEMLCHSQSAFRPLYSTQTAIIGVLEPIREAMDRRRLSVLVTIDIAKAYDSVDHAALLEILKGLNFDRSAVNWFGDYLRGRLATIHVRDGPPPAWRRC
ncbi:uncharacterized protein LOC124170621 [Ischnura elegans]|uniref:uncharacterized protein LOC124170621 n=1 Tax=Ischnura elegans TaxID=197161 RepID=UPI001ED89CCB|nr:uncharacterized protein LOC124170621 [Ischnura elegans]